MALIVLIIMATTNINQNLKDHGLWNPRSNRGGQSQGCKACQVVDMQNPCKIVSWNVGSVFEAGEIDNTIQQLKTMQISILEVSEMCWTGSEFCNVHGYQVYYAGNDDAKHFGGGAIRVENYIAHSVKNYIRISDRVIFVQFSSKPFATNVIQVYVPTPSRSEDDIQAFYKRYQKM